ncbi:MAG: NAD(P)H-dependent oxidoreductase subunit E [Candidatus Aminicenantes bacterium]|nr:NAD(P)H-dependent oxidoreductase subunit E [Candidatus Aminicenantes bacterium]NIM79209.1 NAD(P)H-dependent oxidoreductase subunit E [Candidatus Aminicenantes bacterium]NIN18487.1 NAD(P)H-dependent oxidoreductase subunit E [Candidatus Aminicenantes bacterium]NIN42383.1 NAD(P)H-dependent oxidoreductase subunit E [Candidatus Aminicenantes bacterium]NIN85149.1 NAD(P)H-dependent oxidoreductase subunit E [Candidatus Aminicenantes bacterium]
MEMESILEIVRKCNQEGNGIISILENIQDEFGYLPEEALRTLADETGHPLIDIYGVATFYKSFSLTPRGKYFVTVCVGTACHVRGSQRIREKIEKGLDIRVGETTKDNLFTLEAVNCLGACALGPIVVVNGEYHGNMTVMKTEALFNSLKKQEEQAEEQAEEVLSA